MQVKAYRGYYVSVEEIVSLIDDLLTDAEKRRKEICILNNPEIPKLEGAMMSLRAVKESMYRLERFGDLILQPDPVAKEVQDAPKIVDEAGKPIPKEGNK